LRACEHDRRDALFRDRLARRLAGAYGEQLARATPGGDAYSWAHVVRTFLVDRVIAEQVRGGVDTVINLAAGLDTRPYRMRLPPALRWVEVDYEDVMSYKAEILRPEEPACRLERVSLDLSHVAARRELFGRLGRSAGAALVVTEGLLIYWPADEVRSLAGDLAVPPGFRRWVVDMQTPALLRVSRRATGALLGQAVPLLPFGPEEGAEFFAPHGWGAVAVESILAEAARQGRAAPTAVPPAGGRRDRYRIDGFVCTLARSP
jgi:methyltransferase (TIGR00027 family)